MKTKVIKSKFKDQEDTRTTEHEDATTDTTTNAAPQPHRLTEAAQQQQLAGWSLHLPPALPVVLPPALWAWALPARRGW
jgi:hypothetical protein